MAIHPEGRGTPRSRDERLVDWLTRWTEVGFAFELFCFTWRRALAAGVVLISCVIWWLTPWWPPW